MIEIRHPDGQGRSRVAGALQRRRRGDHREQGRQDLLAVHGERQPGAVSRRSSTSRARTWPSSATATFASTSPRPTCRPSASRRSTSWSSAPRTTGQRHQPRGARAPCCARNPRPARERRPERLLRPRLRDRQRAGRPRTSCAQLYYIGGAGSDGDTAMNNLLAFQNATAPARNGGRDLPKEDHPRQRLPRRIGRADRVRDLVTGVLGANSTPRPGPMSGDSQSQRRNVVDTRVRETLLEERNDRTSTGNLASARPHARSIGTRCATRGGCGLPFADRPHASARQEARLLVPERGVPRLLQSDLQLRPADRRAVRRHARVPDRDRRDRSSMASISSSGTSRARSWTSRSWSGR